MKTYTFKVVIHEGSDEFWDEINKKKKTGCDEVVKLVRQALGEYGINNDDAVTLTRFDDKEDTWMRGL